MQLSFSLVEPEGNEEGNPTAMEPVSVPQTETWQLEPQPEPELSSKAAGKRRAPPPQRLDKRGRAPAKKRSRRGAPVEDDEEDDEEASPSSMRLRIKQE